MRFKFLFVFSFTCLISFTQVPLYNWQVYLPFSEGRHLAIASDKVYCATASGFFEFNISDNYIKPFTKLDDLSDVDIDAIAYDQSTESILIAYANSNIDIIKQGQVTNVPDIERRLISGKKQINSITFYDGMAYLATGFGIVLYDMQNIEFGDTWIIGNNGENIEVFDVVIENGYIYAATEEGIKRADMSSSNLIDFNAWTTEIYFPGNNRPFEYIEIIDNHFCVVNKDDFDNTFIYIGSENEWIELELDDSNVTSVEVAGESFVLGTKTAVYVFDKEGGLHQKIEDYNFGFGQLSVNHVLINENGIWIADSNLGLVRSPDYVNYSYHVPNGPNSTGTYDLCINQDMLYTVKGGRTNSWNNVFNRGELYAFNNNYWTNKVNYDAFDFVELASPKSNKNKVAVGSWGYGVFLYENNELVAHYAESNSSLQSSIPGGDFVRIGGLTYDDNGNLWVVNSTVERPISVFTSDNNWYSYRIPEIASYRIGDIIIASSGKKWILLPNGNGCLVYDDKGTIAEDNDDEYERIDIRNREGKIISNTVYSIAEDTDRNIWIGTNQGVVVFYNPEQVFEGTNFYAQQVVIDIDGAPGYLLGSETVTAIAIDGANRKWFGTESSGVYLISDDGTKQLEHFTAENSPLVSNKILSIEIDQNSGIVYFGTENGLVSYRSDATEGKSLFGEVYAFPNPVRPNYNGPITITGLAEDVHVKITDISGQLVYETTSLGGQAVWSGDNHEGRRVRSGVYLVFCTNDDGSETAITKILIVN